MTLNINQARRLLRFLEAEKAKRGGLKLLSDKINAAIELNQLPKGFEVDEKTIDRILREAKIHGVPDDGHGPKYSEEQLMYSTRRKVDALYKFAELQNFRNEIDPADFLGRVGDFFRTKDDVYNANDLQRLLGTYKMYRRCWFDSPSYNFMQSWVSIYVNDRQSRFRFNEKQNFPDYELVQSSDGYVFPSGTAVLAICNSPQRDTVKFISISDIIPKTSRTFKPVQEFSGNGIATSDLPPHTGYGFHCVRVPDDELPKKRSEYIGQVFNFEEFKKKKVEIFRKIVEYERFQSVDLIPKEPDPLE